MWQVADIRSSRGLESAEFLLNEALQEYLRRIITWSGKTDADILEAILPESPEKAQILRFRRLKDLAHEYGFLDLSDVYVSLFLTATRCPGRALDNLPGTVRHAEHRLLRAVGVSAGPSANGREAGL